MESKEKNPPSSCSESSGEWSDSSCSSFYSDSNSYIPEWDSFVQDDGSLVYIVGKNDTTEQPEQPNVTENVERGGFTRQSVRRSSKGLWLKILKRRNSTRAKKEDPKKPSPSAVDNKVTFSETQKGEIKEVHLEVDFANKSRFGRKNNIVESTLGITASTFHDGKSLMVSGVLPDTPSSHHKQIKIGDWLKEIDGTPVDAHNIDRLLNDYPGSVADVKLTLQRIAGVEVKNVVSDRTAYQFDLTKYLANDHNHEHEIVIGQMLRDSPVAVAYLTTEGLTEDGPESEGVLYCYPRPEKFNFLHSAKGMFITLNHLMPQVLKSDSRPLVCSLVVKECNVNVVFTSNKEELLLIALPESKCNSFELVHLNAEIVNCLEFCHKSLSECFDNGRNTKKLDYFFSRLFSQLLTCGYGWESQKSTRVENILFSSESSSDPLFEQCLPIVQTVQLPWEAQLQLDDVLTELDATCISRSEDNVEEQDIFHIIGTCVYYSGHLLTSHLLQTDLLKIHSFLRLQGFLSISLMGNIKNLIVWKEVHFGTSILSENDNSEKTDCFSYVIPKNRTFIIIVGRGHFLLVTVLRGLQTSKCVPPSPYFVEECESTLELLMDVGLDNFLQQWFNSNLQPQVVLDPDRFLSLSKKESTGVFPGFGKKSSPVSQKSTEIQSILKKRQVLADSNYDNSTNSSNSTSTSLNASKNSRNVSSYAESDDSYSENSASEISEERIQGRRALRDKEANLSRNSLSSDSYTEWDGCEANSQLSGSHELAELSQSLLQKMGGYLPTKITAGGENICFHFVRLENELGILLSPTMNIQIKNENELYKHILKSFRKASQKIHVLLQNTLRNKKMLSPSTSASKSLVAIKEYGMLFEIPPEAIESIFSVKKNEESFSYWVVGRLFEHPKFTEVYVCCHESIPQNMVEVAFRLAFGT